jgi:ketol-acid reductoisomerase
LVEKINNHFETPKKGMTLDGLASLEPRDFFTESKKNPGTGWFTPQEVKKIIKLLSEFGYTLQNMAYSNKYRYGQLVENTNVDWGDEIPVAPKEIEEAATKVFEDIKNFEPINQTQ